jgi:hypothetical protein
MAGVEHVDAKEVDLNSYCIKIHDSNTHISTVPPATCNEGKSGSRRTALHFL